MDDSLVQFRKKTAMLEDRFNNSLKARVLQYKLLLQSILGKNQAKLKHKKSIQVQLSNLNTNQYQPLDQHQFSIQQHSQQFFLTRQKSLNRQQLRSASQSSRRQVKSSAQKLRESQTLIDKQYVLKSLQKEYLQKQQNQLLHCLQKLKQQIAESNQGLKQFKIHSQSVEDTLIQVKTQRNFACYNQSKAQTQLKSLRVNYEQQKKFLSELSNKISKEIDQLRLNDQNYQDQFKSKLQTLKDQAKPLSKLEQQKQIIINKKIDPSSLVTILALFHSLQANYRHKKRKIQKNENLTFIKPKSQKKFFSLEDTFKDKLEKLNKQRQRENYDMNVMIDQYVRNHKKYNFSALSSHIVDYFQQLQSWNNNLQQGFSILTNDKQHKAHQLSCLQNELKSFKRVTLNPNSVSKQFDQRKQSIKERTLTKTKIKINYTLNNLEYVQTTLSDLLARIISMAKIVLNSDFKKIEKHQNDILQLANDISNQKYWRRFLRKRKRELDEFQASVFVEVFGQSPQVAKMSVQFRDLVEKDRTIRMFLSSDKIKKYLQKVKTKFSEQGVSQEEAAKKAFDFLDRLKEIAYKVQKETVGNIFQNLERIMSLINYYNKNIGQATSQPNITNLTNIGHRFTLTQQVQPTIPELNNQKAQIKQNHEEQLINDIIKMDQQSKPLFNRLCKSRKKQTRDLFSSKRLYKTFQLIRRVNSMKSKSKNEQKDYLTGVLGVRYQPIIRIREQSKNS